jgi:TolA-binding protein
LFDRAARAEPAAPLAEDSDFWRAVALTRARRPDSRAALKDFLERHPHSQRTGEASAMLGWQLFEIGEVGAAEAQFVTAAGDRVPRVLASAHAGLAAIAARRARAP